MNSEKIYSTLEKACEEIKQTLKQAGAQGNTRITFWCGYIGIKPYFEISSGNYNDEEKVKGYHLGEMVEELVRRTQFKARQNTLQIGAPTIEGEAK